MELTSACTCPPGMKARNITGHAPDCPRYAEWYRRYAPKDAGPHIAGESPRLATITRDDPAPDQVGPPTGPPGDARAVWSGADWAVADPLYPDAQLRASQHVAAQLAEVTVENLKAAMGGTGPPEDAEHEDGGDGTGQPTGRR